MSKTVLENRATMPQTFFGAPQFIGDLRHIPTTPVLEFAALEQIPDPLLRIEIRGVARQALQVEAFGCASLEKILDDSRTVDGRPVPDHQQLARYLA